jgi:hypothetical protein
MKNTLVDRVILIQGVYYLITAVWPLLHLQSFTAVVGPKPDLFQFYTTTLLILVISVTLLLSVGKEKSLSTIFLALASPIAFIVIEIVWIHSLRQIFLLDIALEVVILAALTASTENLKKPIPSANPNGERGGRGNSTRVKAVRR